MAGKSSVGGSIGGASSSCSSAEGSCRNETRRRGSGPRGRGAGVPRLQAAAPELQIVQQVQEHRTADDLDERLRESVAGLTKRLAAATHGCRDARE